MLHKFLDCIAKNMKKKGKTSIQIDQAIKKIRKRYLQSVIFFDNKEEDLEEEFYDENMLNLNIEEVDHGNFYRSITKQMEKDEESRKKEDVEERIKKWQLYYKDKNLFPDEEQINYKQIDERGNYGRTQLHNAVVTNDIEKLKKLLNEGADFNVKDNGENTPLRLALLEGKNEIVSILKEKTN